MRIRVRLALQYGALFFVAGAILLATTYLLVKQSLDERDGPVTVFIGIDQLPPNPPPEALGEFGEPDQVVTELLREQEVFEAAVLRSLLTGGAIALGIVGLLAIGFGWLMAGRALRPLASITSTARRVAERSLHERIALAGPRDELKELADTFDDMLDRLDRAFDGQRRFAANASHELRTPLTINRTLLEVTLDRPELPEETRQLGETLLAVNARHERLIDGLLMLAQSENELTGTTPLDLAEVAGYVLDNAGPDNAVLDNAGDAGGVTVVSELRPAPTAGDPVLLERLVQNLIDNAIRYNVPGGSVAVTTGREAHDEVYLTVTNTGPTIPLYDIERIFEPFQRLTEHRGTGVGLGLSIVRAVARAHNGTVTAVPGSDGGLAVRFTLPEIR